MRAIRTGRLTNFQTPAPNRYAIGNVGSVAQAKRVPEGGPADT